MLFTNYLLTFDNLHGLICHKTPTNLNGSESVESMDTESDNMVANLQLVDIYKKI